MKAKKQESKKARKQAAGFTIVELLIAVGLFLIVLSIISGAFIEALRTERATLRLMAANDTASFALEQMARDIRVGTDFSLVGPSELHFNDRVGTEAVYRLNAGRVEKRSGAGAFTPITANTALVTTLHFALAGELNTDSLQPRVTIAMSVGATGRDIAGVTTAVQTTVTPRLLDVP
ncbi:MAG: prepilin-type N-terminal cleavage/methylation domain-containing protein [bacterium]|nr:prepilin-type N-terminal cleavage/methylation domain-containing protein [bacterium]